MKDLRDKVAVVTGAGSGIGRALALSLAEHGTHLMLNDIDAVALEGTQRLLSAHSARVQVRTMDVADRNAMLEFANDTVRQFGHVDLVFNNAGIGMGDRPFHETELDLFEQVMRVNFQGTLYGSRAFTPHLLQRPEAALVNVSSVFGLTGIAFNAAYCASKFAVHGLNQALYQEYRSTGLTVHSVHPGGVDTGITRNSIAPTALQEAFHERFLKLSPDRAARTILQGVSAKRPRILIGKEAFSLDLAVRLMPVHGGTMVNRIIRRKVESIQRNTGRS
jgi:NAD(P)-dependent dehydrogenase (short-subunit alcohol dehydrogenase family)